MGSPSGAYGIHYGEIFTATYIQARVNPPQNVTVVVQTPDLVDPLKDVGDISFDPDTRSVRFDIAPDLTVPYTLNYNFSWEFELARDWKIDLSYIGSRSSQLLSMFFLNRARIVDGVPQTTRTVNVRRPDQRSFNLLHVNNGSRGYFDAGRATLRSNTTLEPDDVRASRIPAGRAVFQLVWQTRWPVPCRAGIRRSPPRHYLRSATQSPWCGRSRA